MADDDGVLGNLPRTRPGQRSQKRGPRMAAGAPAPGRQAAPQESSGGDPLSGAARAAGQLAGAALGAAGAVLRRLPRP